MTKTDKDLMALIEKAAKKNYEESNGLFYYYYVQLGIPFDELPQTDKNSMISVIGKLLLNGNIDTRLNEEANSKIFDDIDKSAASDFIILKDKADADKFSNFWKNPGHKKYQGTPCDLFYSRTIPLKNFFIKMEYDWIIDKIPKKLDLDMNYIKDMVKGITVQFVVFDDYIFRLDEPTLDNPIGVVILSDESKKKHKIRIAFPFYPSAQDGNYIMFIGIAYDNIKKDDLGFQNIYSIQKSLTELMDIWYGIQVALLNPITEIIFQKAREKTDSVKKNKIGYGKNRKVVYTKKYRITQEDIDNAYREHRKNNIQCPLWYVIGHWRTYTSGKKIFIQGYWKGSERNKFKGVQLEHKTIQMINSVVRERKIVFDEKRESNNDFIYILSNKKEENE